MVLKKTARFPAICSHIYRISKNILNFLHWVYHLKQKKQSCIMYIIDLSLESCVKDGNSSEDQFVSLWYALSTHLIRIGKICVGKGK